MAEKTKSKQVADTCDTSCFNEEIVIRVQPKISEKPA